MVAAYDLSGKIALVTGGAAGIGRAIALRLAREGSAVAVLDLDRRAALETAERIRAYGVPSAAVVADVGERSEVERGVQDVLQTLGEIDILVNNAGVLRIAPFLETAEQDWHLTFRVNVDGIFHCCQAVVPRMIGRRHGRIVNIASWLGKVGKPYYAAYCASKFAVIGLTQALAPELARRQVTVNAVCPGIVAGTPMRERADEISRKLGLPASAEREGTVPQGRLTQPEDVARVVAFLASEEASHMTGQAVNVTGGLWMH